MDRRLIAIAVLTLFIGLFFLVLKQLPVLRAYEVDWIYNIVQVLIKLPLGLSLMIISFFVPKLMYNYLLLFLGNMSFEVYLVHMKFIDYLKYDGFVLALTCFLFLSVAVSFVFYRFNKWCYSLLVK